MIKKSKAYKIILVLTIFVSAAVFAENYVFSPVTPEEDNAYKRFSKISGRSFKIYSLIDREYLREGDLPYDIDNAFPVGKSHLLTTYTSVEHAASVSVEMPNGELLKVQSVTYDKGRNLALLKVNYDKFYPVTSSDIALPIIGQTVYAHGFNQGISGFSSQGVIGDYGNPLEEDKHNQLDYTGIGSLLKKNYVTSTLNLGENSSGMPVFNTKGKLIGIVDYDVLPDKKYAGIITMIIPAYEFKSYLSK